jgi:high-affinity iron transporter
MFLNAVILILQEILEAALLISVMLVLTQVLKNQWPGNFQVRLGWVLSAIGLGIAGAWLYARVTPAVSAWFDYVGLEVVNALLQFGIIGFLLRYCYGLHPRAIGAAPAQRGKVARSCMIIVVALVIVREGSEIMLYLQGILGQPGNASPVLLGALMASGIGISSGLILFQALGSLAGAWPFRTAMLLLALFAGNMAAQAVLLLTQADWLPFTPQLWDTSGWLPEFSITGQLLYALIGYEANPSLLQAGAYLAAMLLVIVSPLFRFAWQTPGVSTP